MENEITAEEIAQAYSAAMDSVNLINSVIADPAAYANDPTVLQRNVDHLEIMLEQDYWTDEDLEPLNAAIAVDTSAFDALFGD